MSGLQLENSHTPNTPTIKGLGKHRLVARFPNLLTSNNVAINKRRKIPLTFLPPSTNSPLFRYNNDADQRSFLSLCSGSHLDEGECRSDNESVSTFRSLPSNLDGTDDEIESISQWLDEERERQSFLSTDDNFATYGATDDTNLSILQSHERRSRKSSIISIEDVLKETEEENFSLETPNILIEMKRLARYSIPLIVTFFLEQIFSLVCVVFVGHLGKEELAAVSMASMTSTIVLAIFEGIATSLDTLCPQAYGAGQYKYVGIHTLRCSLFSLCVFIPAALVWYFSGCFLSRIIDDQKVVALTQQFLRILIFGGPPYILFENGKRFLQAQGIFDAATYILFITAPLNLFMNWVLVYSSFFGLGYIGAPIASVINFWMMFLLLVLYVKYIEGSECWSGFSAEALYYWFDLSKLAIPGIVMIVAESLAYEILTLFASKFGTSALATQSALSSIVSLLYMIPFAISVASSTRIANFVGGENVNSAKTAINVGYLLAAIIAAFNASIIFYASQYIALLFTEDQEVIKMFVSLSPIVAFFVMLDSIACVANGVLRALAMQAIGGAISLVGYYILAVPLALYLGFIMGMKLEGLWLGNGAGLLLIALTETIIIKHINWNSVIQKSRKLVMHVDA